LFIFSQALDRAKPGMENAKNAAQSRSFKRLVCHQSGYFLLIVSDEIGLVFAERLIFLMNLDCRA